MPFVTHWDEVEVRRLDVGALRARWQDLGRAAGSVGASVKREMIDPGARPTPAHSHGRDEELFYVLAGSGLSWQDGRTHPIGPGDCLLHRPAEAAHTLIAGAEGLEVLAFGTEATASATRLPRAGVFWVGPWWVDDDTDRARRPFEREPEELAGEPGDRPATTVNVGDVPQRVVRHGRSHLLDRSLGDATGSTTTGMSHVTLPAGSEGYPPHCHSAEHEIFVVLGGEGTVLLGAEPHPVRRGSVVARPPGTRVAHSFRAGSEDLEYLAWGTREPNDIAYFPRSGKVFLRGVGVIGRIEPLDYWEGEA